MEKLESEALSQVAEAVSPAVEEARAAAEGIRSWRASEESSGRAGAVYELRAFHLGSESCELELQRAAAALAKLPVGAVEPTWSFRPTTDLDAKSVASMLGDWQRREREERAVGRLSESIFELVRAGSKLDVLSVHGEGPTVRVNGVALVDSVRREALLIVGRITALTTDRRG